MSLFNMKVRILFFLLFISFCSCNIKNKQLPKNDNSIEADSYETNLKIDILSVNDSIVGDKIEGAPQLSYKFNIDSTGYLLKSIIVYSDGSKIQEIIANKQLGSIGNSERFQLIDWNFDGFKDISIYDAWGSGGRTYLIWNYSEKDGRYYYNTRLSEYLGLEIDPVSKYIIFHYRAGYESEYWDSLQYVNNKLKFVKGLHQHSYLDGEGNFWVKKTHNKIVNNQLITSVDSLIIK